MLDSHRAFFKWIWAWNLFFFLFLPPTDHSILWQVWLGSHWRVSSRGEIWLSSTFQMAEDMNFVIPVTQKCSEVLERIFNLPVHKTYLCFPKYWPIQSEFPGEQSIAHGYIENWCCWLHLGSGPGWLCERDRRKALHCNIVDHGYVLPITK